MLNGTYQGSCRTECVVDNQRDAAFLSERRKTSKVGNVEAGVTHRFDIDRLGVVINLCRKAGNIVAISKLDLNP